jgi:hypothetical protein
VGTRSFLKWSGRGFNHSPSSSAKVKERTQLHTYYPLGLRCLLQGKFYI